MGQFLDYLAAVFTSKVEPPVKEKSGFHVTFVDSSINQLFNRSSSSPTSANNNLDSKDQNENLLSKNRNTILLYQSIGFISFLVHLYMVIVPKVKLNSFDLLALEGWQPIVLTLVAVIVYLASIQAMQTINKPLLEGVKLNSKNLIGLDLNNNEFTYSLKIMILLMAICQISSVFADQLIWSTIVIVPLWCYQLTSRVAQSEYQRYGPAPKRQWVNLNLSKSPKAQSPKKEPKAPATPNKVSQNHDNEQVKATPRTRTRRAVKNIVTGVTDKYHAFEQNVAHQLSQKIFNPLSPKLKMVE